MIMSLAELAGKVTCGTLLLEHVINLQRCTATQLMLDVPIVQEIIKLTSDVYHVQEPIIL